MSTNKRWWRVVSPSRRHTLLNAEALQVCVSALYNQRAKQLLSHDRWETQLALQECRGTCLSGLSLAEVRIIPGSERLRTPTRIVRWWRHIFEAIKIPVDNAEAEVNTPRDSKGLLYGPKVTELLTVSFFKTSGKPWWCFVWKPIFLI